MFDMTTGTHTPPKGKQAKPTIKRRRIGSLLRQYREAQKPRILSKEAAKHIGVDPVLLGRIERGEYRIKPDQILALLDLYGIEDPEIGTELVKAAMEPLDSGWWYPYRNDIPSTLLDFITLESEAKEILCVTPAGISGLLQSMSYAREIQESAPLSAVRAHSDMYVQVRLSRKQVITKTVDPAKIHGIIPESIFYSRSASIPSQISHLLSLTQQSNVVLQVMPADIPVGKQIDVHCNLMRFKKPWTPVMYGSVLGGGVLRDDKVSIGEAEDNFFALAESALPVEETRDFFKERLKKINGHP